MSEHDPIELGAYSMGLLGPHETVAVDEHLRTCAECRLEVAGFREIRRLLGMVPADEAPDV